MDHRLNQTAKFLINIACLILLALLTVSITALYIGNEHNFHWWIDWYNATLRVTNAFRESPSEGIEEIIDSLVYERNRIYTLPLIPFILIFGKSRLVYEIALALVYLLPFSLVMGAIATQLIPVKRQIIFWSTAFLTLLIPVNWMATLLGIPDTGGAFFIGLAVFLYLQDINGSSEEGQEERKKGKIKRKINLFLPKLKDWWRIPLIGIFIGLAIVLRRHFVYGGIAVQGAILLQSLIISIQRLRDSRQKLTEESKNPSPLSTVKIIWWNLLSAGVKVGLIGATSLATLWTIAPEFTYNAIATNYRSLYASWTLPFPDIINLYSAFYGWITWLLVAIGFSASILTRAVALPVASLMVIWGIFSLIIWVAILRYGNVFYALHVTPLVIIGLVAFSWTTWTRFQGKVRTITISLLGGYLAINFLMGLTPIIKFDNVFRPLFALSMPPLVRRDYDEVVRLVNYLREIAPNGQPIYVVGYQRLQLNLSAVKSAERVLYEPDDRILNILISPQVDSQDAYPLETLLEAEYVVITNPLVNFPKELTKVPAVGEWLPNQEVDVVQVVFDAFTKNWDIAKDFKRLPEQFTLEDGAKVSIYQRIRPTSLATAMETLIAMKQQIGTQPGGQLDWLVLSQPSPDSLVNKNLDNTYSLVTEHTNDVREVDLSSKTILGRNQSENTSSSSFLYLGSLPETARVTGKVTFSDSPCLPLSIRLAMLDKHGKIVGSAQTTKKEYLPDNSSSFQLSIHGKNPTYLLLDVLSDNRNQTSNSCTIDINDLSVSNG